ncbi:hypothetical protein BIU82_03240 [Arthrobacter sp. SW1]|uniref:muramidase family protein n=1 Tax=Arthrobacter sp. SW1 TaxID=1920889 RepID=UPI000877B967|nr:LysM peptidoglycan-binding domain-containing protein [Arthrobacter sp. SW1]OFI38364.1 hypothetical protein BIU82_03240 [Arthrobacter sp. SW1]
MAGLADCGGPENPAAKAPASTAAAGPETTEPSPAPAAEKPEDLAGAKALDSFGNADFYTTAEGDTLAGVAAAFRLSEAKLASFNGLTEGAPLRQGTKLRLIPPSGPMPGAAGTATEDSNGIPQSYAVVEKDTLDGITYRFGITEEQLAEANKAPFLHEQGNVYFLHPGKTLQLQKKPVDPRSGKGQIVRNSFAHPVYYTTVAGDSLDSLGYAFRRTTEQLLRYNPELRDGSSLPAGTKVTLMPGAVTLNGARGSFTTDANGVPLTYTTAAGDTERQVAFRFNLEMVDLGTANRPRTAGERTWYRFTGLAGGELAAGQTISLSADKPITGK